MHLKHYIVEKIYDRSICIFLCHLVILSLISVIFQLYTMRSAFGDINRLKGAENILLLFL